VFPEIFLSNGNARICSEGEPNRWMAQRCSFLLQHCIGPTRSMGHSTSRRFRAMNQAFS
jgi:hypothetical protein